MRLEKKKEQEIAQRQGMTGKTIIQVVWLGISAVVAYFVLTFLLESEQGGFTYSTIYNMFLIPRSVPRWVILGGLILIFVLLMQFFLSLGFAIASPDGRRKTGVPSLYSRNKDPFDDQF